MEQLPFLGKFKTTLIMSDETLDVYRSTGSGAELAGSMQWSDRDFMAKALSAIKRCGPYPLVVLNDTSEQFYKADKVPLVRNPLDRRNMIKRKTVAAFPQYSITGAVLHSTKRNSSGQGDVILAAVASSQKMQKISNVLSYSRLQVWGMGLLPVEAASLVAALSDRLNKNKAKDVVTWTVFLAQSRSGGLRQIVVKDGNLALTRLTPLSDDESEPEVWASEVSQELKASITYLSRFNYKPEDNLEVVVVADPSAGQILEGLVEVTCDFYSLTVEQAGEMVGISLPESVDYFDPVYARWAANKPSFAMDMKPPSVGKLAKARATSMAATVVLVATLFYFSAQTVATYKGYQSARTDIEEAEQRKKKAQREYDQAAQDNTVTQDDVELVKGGSGAFAFYEGKGIKPTPYIQKISEVMQPFNQNFSLVSMEYTEIKPEKNQGFLGAGLAALRGRQVDEGPGSLKVPTGNIDIRLRMTFPGTIAPEIGNARVKTISSALAKGFEDMGLEVEIAKYLKDLSASSDYIDSAGLSAGSVRDENSFTAEIRIFGGVS